MASPSLDLGGGSPKDVLSGMISFIQAGGTLGNVLSGFIFGLGASLFLGVGQIIDAVANFIATPFLEGGQAIATLITGLFTAPATILEETAFTSATGISQQFGWLAFLVGVGVVLAALYMVVQYLEQRETGDTFIGLPFDTPDIGPFEIGVTEETEEER